MNAFTMPVEYIDSESGEWVTETALIDDVEVYPADPFLPAVELDYSDECPW